MSGYRFRAISGKTFCLWSVDQFLRCTNLTLATIGSHMNKQVEIVFVNYLQLIYQLDTVTCKSTHTIRIYGAQGIVKQKR